MVARKRTQLSAFSDFVANQGVPALTSPDEIVASMKKASKKWAKFLKEHKDVDWWYTPKPPPDPERN